MVSGVGPRHVEQSHGQLQLNQHPPTRYLKEPNALRRIRANITLLQVTLLYFVELIEQFIDLYNEQS